MHLVILGLGYSARHTLPLLPAGWTVAGTTRDAARAERLASRGIAMVPAEDGAAVAAEIGRASHILVSAGPGRDGDPFLAAQGPALAAAASGRLKGIVYLSTIGVYGNTDGAWVDETAPVARAAPRHAPRIAAEEGWQALGAAHGIPVAILRLGGIYGPARNAFVNLARGTARRILLDGQVFNRIHVADVAQAAAAALTQGFDGIVNVTDGDPTPADEPIAFAAGLMGVDLPPAIPYEAAEFTPMARSFWEENRRVRSDRLRTDLGVTLAAPTYREGLGALWRDRTFAGDAEDRAEASPRFRSG